MYISAVWCNEFKKVEKILVNLKTSHCQKGDRQQKAKTNDLDIQEFKGLGWREKIQRNAEFNSKFFYFVLSCVKPD